MGNEIGRVKWYGGYNSKTGKENDYGFIERYDGKDVFVHSSRLICLPSELYDGVFVIFNLIEGKKGYEAEKVQIYVSKIDDEIITDDFIISILGWLKRDNSIINRLPNNLLLKLQYKAEVPILLLILIELFKRTLSEEFIYEIKKCVENNPNLYDKLPDTLKHHKIILDLLPSKEQ
ncbi:MAG: cold shock domain-containing protein, partial [Anaerolineae bacterium]|nr:cold shock domain-containing protein [Anaerolineae bacterium]